MNPGRQFWGSHRWDIYPATPLEGLRPGTVLYRNADKAFFDVLDGAAACRRTIAVDVTLRMEIQDVCRSN